MKKSKDEVIELLSNREIEDYGLKTNEVGYILFFWIIIDTITWKELSNEWLRENIIDIQPWDNEYIRIAIDNVY